jgi:nicotinamidase-related amidase
MLNPYEHEHADALAAHVAEALDAITTLTDRARGEDAEVIYVNDNYGDWNSSSEELAKRAVKGRHPELVEPLLPKQGDAFVIKARHTIFYGTPLEYLLDTSGVTRLVLAGQVTEQCVLYSALDAYVRHFEVVIPTDCVAPIHEHLGKAAIEMMERNMSAEIVDAASCDLQR